MTQRPVCLPDPAQDAMAAGYMPGCEIEIPATPDYYTADQMEAYAAAAVAAERERINLLLAAIREHWIKANGPESLSVSALDVIAAVIADGSYVDDAPAGLPITADYPGRDN